MGQWVINLSGQGQSDYDFKATLAKAQEVARNLGNATNGFVSTQDNDGATHSKNMTPDDLTSPVTALVEAQQTTETPANDG